MRSISKIKIIKVFPVNSISLPGHYSLQAGSHEMITCESGIIMIMIMIMIIITIFTEDNTKLTLTSYMNWCLFPRLPPQNCYAHQLVLHHLHV